MQESSIDSLDSDDENEYEQEKEEVGDKMNDSDDIKSESCSDH